MDRRGFFKISKDSLLYAASLSAVSATVLWGDEGRFMQKFERVKLLDCYNNPLKEETLKEEETYIFNYPYVSTPAFLLKLKNPPKEQMRLKDEEGNEYLWRGGVGKEGKIVSYMAICTHQLAHPNPLESFVGYVGENQRSSAYSKGGVIVCSSHLSVFDPRRGGIPLTGPARSPLAAVVLESDSNGDLWAVGVAGSVRFREFFRSFRPEFKRFYGGLRKAKRFVFGATVVKPISQYTKEVVIF